MTKQATLTCDCGSTNVWTATRPTRPTQRNECVAECQDCRCTWDVTDLYYERYADYYALVSTKKF